MERYRKYKCCFFNWFWVYIILKDTALLSQFSLSNIFFTKLWKELSFPGCFLNGIYMYGLLKIITAIWITVCWNIMVHVALLAPYLETHLYRNLILKQFHAVQFFSGDKIRGHSPIIRHSGFQYPCYLKMLVSTYTWLSNLNISFDEYYIDCVTQITNQMLYQGLYNK